MNKEQSTYEELLERCQRLEKERNRRIHNDRELAKAKSDADQSLRHLSLVQEYGQHALFLRDKSALIDYTIETIIKIYECETAIFYSYDPESKLLVALGNFDDSIQGIDVPLTYVIDPEQVENTPTYTFDREKFYPCWLRKGIANGIFSYFFSEEGEVMGAILAGNSPDGLDIYPPLLESQQPHFAILSSLVGVLWHNINLFSQLADYTKELESYREQLESEVESRTRLLNIRNQELDFLNGQLQEQATLDHLTQLLNRRGLSDKLSNLWEFHQRAGSSLVIAMCDIDWFKPYNDNYGHPAGDRCIQDIAQLIRQSIPRKSDIIARYGGEEFLIVLSQTSTADAKELLTRLLNNVQTAQLKHAYSEFGIVTCSIGFARATPSKDSDYTSLISVADEALYQAKTNGRNQLVEYISPDKR